MMRAVVPILLGTLVTAHAQPLSKWGRSLTVTVNTAATGGGANVATAVANYPLLLRLDSANAPALFAEALTSGADLRVGDMSGNRLPYEIESWSATRASVWVLVPSIAGNGSTTLKIYWGKPGVTSESNPAAVFPPSLGFDAVFHLGEATGDTARDATGAFKGVPVIGTTAGSAAPANVGGAIGAAKNFGGNAADNADSALKGGAYRLETAAGGNTFNSFNYVGTDAAFTISAWVNTAAFPAGFSRRRGIVTKADHGLNQLDNNDPLTQWFLRPNTAPRVMVFQRVAAVGLGTAPYSVGSNTGDGGITGVLNNWNYVTFIASGAGVDDNLLRIYNAAGRLSKAIPDQDGAHLDADVFIGGFAGNSGAGSPKSNGTHYFNGLIDEVRLSNVARTPAWADLDFETQKAGVTAVAYGAAQTQDTGRVFQYAVRSANFIVNQAITALTPFVSAGTITTASVQPALPTGLSLSSAGVISGTPTAVSASAAYVITATIGGNPHLDTLTLSVSAGTPPAAPTGVTASVAPGQATVSWSAPAAGTSPITGYFARATQDTTKNCTWSTGPLSCVITGLMNGTSYTFVVRAASAVGNGAFSAPSASVTPASVPGAPTNVVAAQAGTAASVTLTWTPPASSGGSPVTDYYGTSAPGGFLCYSPASPTPSCTVTGLTFGTSYTFTVLAANALGNGPASAPSNAVIPVGLAGPLLPIQVDGSLRAFTFRVGGDAARSGVVTLWISDIRGRTVWSRSVNLSQTKTPDIAWNGTSSVGRPVSPGTYLVRARVERDGLISETFVTVVKSK